MVEESWVEDFSGLDPTRSFVPFDAQNCTLEDLVTNLPADQTRATFIDKGNMLKNIFNVTKADKLRSYVGGYWSTDQYGQKIRLSGRIVIPKNKKVKRIMIFNHYTICANKEAPSMSLPFESIMAELGIAIVQPDYLGYGLSADRIVPYLNGELTARNVVDMYLASLPFFEHIGVIPEEDDIYIYGYSQGGATAMFVTRELERHHPEVKTRITFAGAGPYDICATYDQLIENDDTDFPFTIPFIIQGMNVGYQLDLDYADYFQPRIIEHMDDWLNSKKYVGSEVNRLIGSQRISDILTPEAMNKRSRDMSAIYRSMIDNSLPYDNSWYPQTPVYAFHSIDDNVVPLINSYRMVEKYQTHGNLTLNVGHYGSHLVGGLHFMYSVMNYLKDNEDI